MGLFCTLLTTYKYLIFEKLIKYSFIFLILSFTTYFINFHQFMNYLDLKYAERLYLVILYETIITDIQNNTRHGRIVRQLVKDGSSLEKAENLYLYVHTNFDKAIQFKDNIKNSLIKTRNEFEADIEEERRIRKKNLEEVSKMTDMFYEKLTDIALDLGVDIFKKVIGMG